MNKKREQSILCLGNSAIELDCGVAKEVEAMVDDYGLEVSSMDVDVIHCEFADLNILNVHVKDNTALNTDEFKERLLNLVKMGDEYDWDVYFLTGNHKRNALLETMFGITQ